MVIVVAVVVLVAAAAIAVLLRSVSRLAEENTLLHMQAMRSEREHTETLHATYEAGHKAGYDKAANEIRSKIFVGERVCLHASVPDHATTEQRDRYVERVVLPQARQRLQDDGWWPISPPELQWSLDTHLDAYRPVQRLQMTFACLPTQPIPPEGRYFEITAGDLDLR